MLFFKYALAFLILSASACTVKINTEQLGTLQGSTTPTATPTPTPTPVAVSASYSLSNGWSDLRLQVSLNFPGSFHWAVFDSDAGALSSAQVKALVGNCTGSCKHAASVAVPTASTPVTSTVSTLADKVLYTVYAVSESTGGLDLDSNVKKYSQVIPKKISLQTFTSTRSTFPLIRHWLYYPPGYYNSTSTVPLLMYIHGGGETPNSAGNAETLFTSGSTRMEKVPFYPKIYQGDELPFVIVSPQCNGAFFSCTNGWESAFYDEVATRAKTIARINLKKVYIYGMSWGGAGTWGYAYDLPTKVTAIVPMSGGLMSRTLSNLCTKFVPNNIAVWATVTVNDPYYSPALSGGTYAGVAVSTYNGCVGHADARFTESPGNTYPATVNSHYTVEFFLGIPFYYYSGNGWYYNNGGTNTFDVALPSIPPASRNVPLSAEMTTELAAASTYYGVTLNSVYDWMALQSKP